AARNSRFERQLTAYQCAPVAERTDSLAAAVGTASLPSNCGSTLHFTYRDRVRASAPEKDIRDEPPRGDFAQPSDREELFFGEQGRMTEAAALLRRRRVYHDFGVIGGRSATYRKKQALRGECLSQNVPIRQTQVARPMRAGRYGIRAA